MTQQLKSAETWQARLAYIVDMMREMSRQTDPQEMVRAYGEKVSRLVQIDRRLSISRRDLAHPNVRITRSTTWTTNINPWKERDLLPIVEGGLLAELIYGNEPRVIDDLQIAADDPAFEYFQGHRSLLAIPMFDEGVSLNMVVLMRTEPAAFVKEQIPDLVLQSNLFGRATANLVLSDELRRAYQRLDQEFKIVGDIQRSLLPKKLPQIQTMDLAAYYQPSTRAGGDYYDFFALPDGRWGIWIADVSGHGTPAAVLMAITHCLAHTHPGPPITPSKLLGYVNNQLTQRYTGFSDSFVTAFYGIYDPAQRTLRYSSAGHNPPRVKHCHDGTLESLSHAGSLPLGIFPDSPYSEAVMQLRPGDQIIFYTDGVTEAHNPQGELSGVEQLDTVLENCTLQASALLDSVLQAVDAFAAGRPADDDRTLIVARIS